MHNDNNGTQMDNTPETPEALEAVKGLTSDEILKSLENCKSIDEMNKVLEGTGITVREKEGETSCEITPEGKSLWNGGVKDKVIEQHKVIFAGREKIAAELHDLTRRVPSMFTQVRALAGAIMGEAIAGLGPDEGILGKLKQQAAQTEAEYEAKAAPIRAERLRRKAEALAKRASKK